MSAENTKPQWSWTHNGASGEKLCKCEGKYYTEFAWDNFLEAYGGVVCPRDTPILTVRISGDETDGWIVCKLDWTSPGIEIDFSDLDTDPGFPPGKP